LEPGPAGSLGNHQRGGSLNIQDLYSHYQKGAIGGPTGTNARNVTYYSNKNTQPQQFQNFQQLDQNLAQHHNNFMHSSNVQSPNAGNMTSGQADGRVVNVTNQNNNNIFVPGSMRFAAMNRQ
jgi:hypothetical protein